MAGGTSLKSTRPTLLTLLTSLACLTASQVFAFTIVVADYSPLKLATEDM